LIGSLYTDYNFYGGRHVARKDLNAVPLSFTINNTDVDPSMWTADDFYYNTRTFTRDVLIDLYMSDGLEKVVIPESHYDVIRKTLSAKVKNTPNAILPHPGPKMLYRPAHQSEGLSSGWTGSSMQVLAMLDKICYRFSALDPNSVLSSGWLLVPDPISRTSCSRVNALLMKFR
jgi:hypothetical protein